MAAVGVDEAGRGPVLGSMFAAAVRLPARVSLPDGVDDSKRVRPERRERLDAAIRALDGVAVAVAEIPVRRIDDPSTDMNRLTVAAQAEALADVARDGDVARLDAGEVDACRFAGRVGDAVDARIDARAEHRADERHPLVGAASVVAKVARDTHVDALAERYGDVGSGYPSDPTSREFLREYVREHDSLPECARTSWRTCADLLSAARQSALEEF